MSAIADQRREHLRWEIDSYARLGSEVHRLLRDHGTFYDWASHDLDYGTLKECYKNCTDYVNGAWFNDESDWEYCEGLAITEGLPIAIEHAWLVNTETGQIADITWRSGGRDCGFCLGNGTIEVEIDEEYGETEERECGWCEGTGEQDHEHRERADTVYCGIAMSLETLTEAQAASGWYPVLGREESVAVLKDKLEKAHELC